VCTNIETFLFIQETARKRKGWTLDTVSLGSDVMRCFNDDVKGPPLEGVYVHGIVLDNAAWDTRASRIIDAKQQVHIRPIRRTRIAPHGMALWLTPMTELLDVTCHMGSHKCYPTAT